MQCISIIQVKKNDTENKNKKQSKNKQMESKVMLV